MPDDILSPAPGRAILPVQPVPENETPVIVRVDEVRAEFDGESFLVSCSPPWDDDINPTHLDVPVESVLVFLTVRLLSSGVYEVMGQAGFDFLMHKAAEHLQPLVNLVQRMPAINLADMRVGGHG